MSRITLACPTCGHSVVIDEAAIQTGPVKVKCARCQGRFIFTKGPEVPPAGPRTSTAPPAPGRGKVSPPSPGERRWASPPQRKTPPPASSRRRLPAVIGAVAFGAVVVVAVWMSVFKVTPLVEEKLLIAALFSKVPPVQRVAVRALREYPTKHAAVALVLFINLKNLQRVPDPKKPETPEELARRQEIRARDLALAERATETLCLLTGHSFGTYFKLEPYGHSWGSLNEDKWPSVLQHIDAWALETFGDIHLPILSLGLPGFPPQPAAASGGGGAR